MNTLANVLLDGSGLIRSWNALAQGLFGYSDTAIVRQEVTRLFADLDRAGLQQLLRTAAAAGYADYGGQGKRQDGSVFSARALITALRAGDQAPDYSLVVSDITESRKAKGVLRLADHDRGYANEQLHGIIHSAMDAIITTDRAQRIVVFNEAAEKIFRCPAETAIGGSLDRFIPERFRAAHKAHVERFGATRVTTRMMGARLQLFGLRADGDEFPIDASISQVTTDGERFYTVILRDITERKAAEDALERSYNELREMSATMHEVREAERTRIARELHDELAQWLTALRMDVSWLSTRLPHGQPHLLERTAKMKQLVDTTVMAVRRIAADLRPVMLDDLGLMPSIEHLLHEFSERTHLAISLDLRAGEVEFHDPLATSVYRMVQEALTNVVRHAQASEVQVAMTLDDGTLLVRVRDNGIGLPPDSAERKSYGILGIKERAQMLGGRAEIRTHPDGGTIVEIFIPAARYRKAEAAL